MRLAWIGSIKDEILNIDELGMLFIEYMLEEYPGVLHARYGVAEEAADGENAAAKVLEEIAVNRKCIKKGNEYDYSKAAALVIDEFRSGQLGALTLESPEQDA